MDRRVIPAPVAGSSSLVFDGILFYASLRRGSYPDTVADRLIFGSTAWRRGWLPTRPFGDTDRDAIIRVRRGQGLFKQRVMEIETNVPLRCRIQFTSLPALAMHAQLVRTAPTPKHTAASQPR